MRSYYFDASALAKRYAPETGSALIDYLFAGAASDTFYVFNVGISEVVSVLVRKRNAGTIPATAFAQALINLRTEVMASPDFQKLFADNALVSAALPLIGGAFPEWNRRDIVLRSTLDIAALIRSRVGLVQTWATNHPVIVKVGCPKKVAARELGNVGNVGNVTFFDSVSQRGATTCEFLASKSPIAAEPQPNLLAKPRSSRRNGDRCQSLTTAPEERDAHLSNEICCPCHRRSLRL